MKKSSKSKAGNVPKVDPYLEGVVAKLLDRLVGLEKKVDVVIAQTAGKQNQEANQPPRRERTLYEAICADCHKVCEVPFRPSEDRPVYCKECFAKRKSGSSVKVGLPVLTPVALAPKPVSKPIFSQPPASPAPATAKKPKKNKPVKKAKKKK